jgi:hypothetical protein
MITQKIACQMIRRRTYTYDDVGQIWKGPKERKIIPAPPRKLEFFLLWRVGGGVIILPEQQ